MKVLRKIGTRAGRAAVLVAATVGLTAVLPAAPAAAAPPFFSSLEITRAHAGHYYVKVTGIFAADPYDAHGFVNNIRNGGVRYEVIGQDRFTELRSTYFRSGARQPGNGADWYLYATPDGIGYHVTMTVPASVVNEDTSSWTGGPGDEIWVRASFLDGAGEYRYVQHSQQVNGYFS
ncbi:hypothetical protein [Pseudonocardia lacus]|uniref:hypothetical protein n=1 Tax=Pseudonocardia lacus TaxID=2835865 RepID=UPI001BDCE296|nr:hypothetical protein [Pseudonocardia lacus]